MTEIKFDSSDLPKLLLDINLNGETIDLHNDFDCINVKVIEKSLIITLEKTSYENGYLPNTKYDNIIITFKEFESDYLEELLIQKYPRTIDNFSIGKANSYEKSYAKKALFILAFVDSREFEIIATEALLQFYN